MNHKFLNNQLGVPIGTSNFKNGLETGAVLGIAALALSAIGTTVNAVATNKTNQANERINQQNINAAEQQQLEAERYNNPVNQRAMLEEAGYSPYAYLQQSSSVGSANIPSPIAMQRPDLGFDKMADMMFNLPGMQANVGKTKSETQLLDVEGAIKKAQEQYASDKALWEMIEHKHNAEKLGYDKEISFWKQKIDAFSFDDQVQNFYLTNEMLRHGIEKTVADTSVVTLQKLMAEKELAVKDKMLDNELKIQLQQIDTLAAQQGMYNAQAREAVEAAFLNAANRNNVNVNTQRLKATAAAYISEQQSNAVLRKWQALAAKNSANNNFDPNFNVRNEDSLRGKVWRSTKYAGDILKNIVPISIGLHNTD